MEKKKNFVIGTLLAAIVLISVGYAALTTTLNINGTGAKPIYINGNASSASNYTLPAGSY